MTVKVLTASLLPALFTIGLAFVLLPAPHTQATELLPSDPSSTTTATATLKPNQYFWLAPNNAYSDLAFGCTSAGFVLHLPNSDYDEPAGKFSFNQNRKGVGTYSSDSGGVIINIDPLTFEKCAIYGPLTQNMQDYNTATDPAPLAVPDLLLNTETENEWTVSVDRPSSTGAAYAAVTMPPSAIQTTIPTPLGNWQIDIAPGLSQTLLADFINGSPTADAELLIDSQVKWNAVNTGSAACQLLVSLGIWLDSKKGPAVMQFEGDFYVTTPNDYLRIEY